MKLDNNINLYEVKTLLDGISYPLYNLATWKNGLPFKKINFSDSGIPVIKIAELNNGIGATTAYTNQIFSDDVHLKKGDLLFSWSGNPETSIDIFAFGLEEGWLNQHIFKVTPDESIIDRDYFYYLMKYLKPRFTKIAMNKQTTGLGHVTIADLKSLKIILPSLIVQKDIASRLKPLDEKIELNNKINQNLLEQAKSLYTSWFLNFEPFNGVKPPEWNDGSINDLAKEIICGKTPSTKVPEYYGKDIPFITIPDMHGCVYNVKTERYLSFEGAASQANKTLPPNTICVSCIGTAGLVTLVSEESQTNQQINSIIPNKDKYTYYIFLLMLTLSDIINKIGQSGSTFVNLNKTQFGKISAVVPDEKTMLDFDCLCKPLFETILLKQKENISLSTLRDALLPKLMSGEIDVSSLDI